MRIRSWRYQLPLRLRSLFRRRAIETELDSEVAFHLEMQIEANRAQGMTDEEARYAARRQFGGVTQIEEECRDMRKLGWLEDLFQDVRLSLRSLRKTPGFVLIAVLSLALGIGANAALFSVMDAVLLHAVPLPAPDRLFLIKEQKRGRDSSSNPPRLYDWQTHLSSVSAIAASYSETLALASPGGAQRFVVRRTAGDILGVWGTQPVRGRAFTAAEQRGEGPPVALLSNESWKRRFDGRASVLGETISLSGTAFTIIGILPAKAAPIFDGEHPGGEDFIAPMAPNVQRVNRRAGFLIAIARLKDGVSPQQAQAELDAVASRLAADYPDSDALLTARYRSLEQEVSQPVVEQLPLLAATAAVILLLACVNLAGLLTARGLRRRREAAIRVALGSGRSRLIRLFLAESVCVALFGCAAGLLVAGSGIRVLLRLLPEDLPNASAAHIDSSAILLAVALSLFCGIVAGAAPAWIVTREAIAGGLKEGSAATAGVGRHRLLSVFVVGEVALSMILLIGAGLLGRTLQRLSTQPLGFRPEQTLAVYIPFPWNTPPSRIDAFYREALEKFAALPGVRTVGVIDRLPLEGGTQTVHFAIRDVELPPDAASESVSLRATSPGYFAAIGAPLVEGEPLADRAGDGPRSAVVNQAFVQRYLSGRSAVGRYLTVNQPGPDKNAAPKWWRIAGVLADIRQEAAQPAPPEVYVLASDTYWPQPTFVFRAQSDPRPLATAVRQAVRELDPNLLIERMRPVEDSVFSANAAPRLRSQLLGGFAAVALFLAVIGVYGILSQDVARRTQEFGVRLALGAKPAAIGALALRRGLLLGGIGIAIGLAGALAFSRYLKAFLYGVAPTDKPTFLMSIGILLAASLLASYLPARRAARVDPLTALRHD